MLLCVDIGYHSFPRVLTALLPLLSFPELLFLLTVGLPSVFLLSLFILLPLVERFFGLAPLLLLEAGLLLLLTEALLRSFFLLRLHFCNLLLFFLREVAVESIDHVLLVRHRHAHAAIGGLGYGGLVEGIHRHREIFLLLHSHRRVVVLTASHEVKAFCLLVLLALRIYLLLSQIVVHFRLTRVFDIEGLHSLLFVLIYYIIVNSASVALRVGEYQGGFLLHALNGLF